MARQTGARVEHRELGVSAGREQGQWLVAPGQFVMAAHAGFSPVAQGARGPVLGGIPAMDVVFPAYAVRCRPHDLVATDTLISTGHRGLHCRVADETFGAGGGGFRLVMGPESLGMEIRLHKARMACGGRAGTLFHVAGLAIGHPEIGGNGFVVVVTLHAVHHFWKRQVSQARAGGDGVVTRCAIQVELLPGPEVSDMAEFQVDSNAGNDVRRDQAPVFCKSWVFNLLRCMAPAAVGRGGIGAERGLHPGLRVALGALSVAGKSRKNSFGVEFVAEGAIRPKAGLGIDPAFGIDVAGVGKLEQNCTLLFVAREGEQRIRTRGWKGGVTLVADLLIQVRAEGISVARHALVVARTF